MDRYQQVFENNKKWIIEKTADNAAYFKDMETGQQPDFLFIGCSDSRVPANEIMGLAPVKCLFTGMHFDELGSITDLDLRQKRLAELNVTEQCLNVAKSAAVQKAYFKGELKGVYGWVYDVGTGELIDLKIDIKSIADKFKEIYLLNKD